MEVKQKTLYELSLTEKEYKIILCALGGIRVEDVNRWAHDEMCWTLSVNEKDVENLYFDFEGVFKSR